MADWSPSSLPNDPGFFATVGTTTLVQLTGTALDFYPSLLGSLQYAVVCSRLDIYTTLNIQGSIMSDPSELHL
jgi:hypothetical protein